MTDGSAKVDVSPSSSYLFAAIFLKIRRMILPERVLGNPGTICDKVIAYNYIRAKHINFGIGLKQH